jgi:DNA-binding CsgD family transcriptional regulator
VSLTSSPDHRPARRALERALVEIQQLEREIVELQYVRRSDALEGVRDAVRRLGEVGAPQGILVRAAEELGRSSGFGRVLISEVVERTLVPRAVWVDGERAAAEEALEALAAKPIELEYPLIEEEVARGRRVAIVSVSDARGRAAGALRAAFAWESYVVAALTVHGQTVGLLHADGAPSGRRLDPLDAEIAARFTEGLAGVFERAVLRETLQLHRSELQSAVQWMSGRLGELASGTPELGAAALAAGASELVQTLTPRERQVLQLLARGQTNLQIAGLLFVREGTVKYHVKNVLRKLGATSRADAVARYARATGAVSAR